MVISSSHSGPDGYKEKTGLPEGDIKRIEVRKKGLHRLQHGTHSQSAKTAGGADLLIEEQIQTVYRKAEDYGKTGVNQHQFCQTGALLL